MWFKIVCGALYLYTHVMTDCCVAFKSIIKKVLSLTSKPLCPQHLSVSIGCIKIIGLVFPILPSMFITQMFVTTFIAERKVPTKLCAQSLNVSESLYVYLSTGNNASDMSAMNFIKLKSLNRYKRSLLSLRWQC